MKHARADYAHIQDPTGKIPEDEPVFLIRGQDKHAATILRAYAHLVRQGGGDPEIVRLTIAQADAMDAWPKKKTSDLFGTMPDFVIPDPTGWPTNTVNVIDNRERIKEYAADAMDARPKKKTPDL